MDGVVLGWLHDRIYGLVMCILILLPWCLGALLQLFVTYASGDRHLYRNSFDVLCGQSSIAKDVTQVIFEAKKRQYHLCRKHEI